MSPPQWAAPKRLRAPDGTGCPPAGIDALLLIAGTYRMRTEFLDGSAPAWDTRSPEHLLGDSRSTFREARIRC